MDEATTKKDLREIDENDNNEGEEVDKPPRELLNGFKKSNLKIHFLANTDFKDLSKKSKYQRLFDVGVLSLNSTGAIGKELTACFKDRAVIHAETADFLVSLKEDKKAEYRGAVVKKAIETGWK